MIEMVFYYGIGVILAALGVASKSTAVFIVGAYYFINFPLGHMLSHDKHLWYPVFGALNLILAAYLVMTGGTLLYIAATAFFVSAMVIMATYYGWATGARLFDFMSYMLMCCVVASAAAHASMRLV